MSKILQILLVLLFFIVIRVEMKSTNLNSIFKATKKSILSKSEDILDKTLKKYYFTANKDESVWWFAQQEIYKMFRIKLDKKELLAMETSINKLKSHYNTCKRMQLNQRRSQCFYNIAEIIRGTKQNFVWDTSSRVSKGYRARVGTLYLSFSSMSAILSSIATMNFEYLNDHKKIKSSVEKFRELMEKLKTLFFVYRSAVTTWRLDQISPVKICEIKPVFWKEFKGVCETRWKRSIKKNNIAELENLEFDDNSDDDPTLNIIDGIGGKTHFNIQRYRGEVFDDVTKETLYFKEVTVNDVDTRGNKLNEIYREGIEKRGVQARKIEKDMEEFHNRTICLAESSIDAFYELIKKILIL